ncbi:GGDEF domain-containing protein [Psychrobium sp. 1_MG-2023]|uniref:GGDEF domain-containing protein n=1 Tax=Psychrobium sp. 1_MG-2023 TaxID=3062624 RepID=UPI00273534D8|nr:GGDEF domain-containing protein [Psychrobium sp. 1_MG-2023]MDP2560810.1 GGDEF domain-containing protein [Psychrobium sp. 1_MG-2023]
MKKLAVLVLLTLWCFSSGALDSKYGVLTADERIAFKALFKKISSTDIPDYNQRFLAIEKKLTNTRSLEKKQQLTYQLILFSRAYFDFANLKKYALSLKELSAINQDKTLGTIADLYLIVAMHQRDREARVQSLEAYLTRRNLGDDFLVQLHFDLIKGEQAQIFKYLLALEKRPELVIEKYYVLHNVRESEKNNTVLISYFEQELELVLAHKFPYLKYAEMFNIIRYLSDFMQENELALELALEYLEQAEKLQDKTELFFAYNKLGDIYKSMAELNLSFASYEKAREAYLAATNYAKSGSSEWLAQMGRQKAMTYIVLGDFKKARASFEKYLSYEQANRIENNHYSMRIEAYFDIQQGRISQGIAKLEQASALMRNSRVHNNYNYLTELAKIAEREKEAVLLAETRLLYFKGAAIGLAIMTLLAMRLAYTHRKKSLQLKVKGDALKHLARKDGLTQLNNRRYWQELFEREFIRLSRSSTNRACHIMLDIDHFKKVNDTYGHIAGDKVIQHLAQLLSKSMRQVDVVGRYGGEEFAILLPDTDLQQAISIAQRIKSDVEATCVVELGQAINFTVSMGIAAFSDELKGPEHWMDQADNALYQAKRDGRNCIRVAEQSL